MRSRFGALVFLEADDFVLLAPADLERDVFLDGVRDLLIDLDVLGALRLKCLWGSGRPKKRYSFDLYFSGSADLRESILS